MRFKNPLEAMQKELFFCMVFFFTACYSNQKSFERGIAKQPYDVVIVPGFPHEGEHWDKVVKMRVIWAKYLFQKGYSKNIIFSGGAVYTPYVESKVMAMYAEALGIPKEHIFVETSAEHSTENIYYSYRLALQLGFKNIALASDPFQTKRTKSFIEKFELPIGSIPIVLDTLFLLEMEEPKIDVSLAKVDSFVALPDREKLYTRLGGTFGKHIKWHKEDLKKPSLRKRYKKNIIDA